MLSFEKLRFFRIIAQIFFGAVFFLLPTVAAFGERPSSARTNDSIIYHGKLVRPDGTPITGSLAVTLKIYSPEPSLCLLWAESQTIEANNGGFSIELGYSENRIAGLQGGVAASFREVFLNNPGLILSGAQCESGTSYTPGLSDDRLMGAVFLDAGQSVAIENIPIKSVPFAKQAQEIAGFGINSIFKISGNGSTIQFAPEEVQRLKAAAAMGSANQVLGVNAAGNAIEYKSIVAGSGVILNQTPGGIEISSVSGGSGTVTSVGVNGAPLSVSAATTTPMISISQASGSSPGFLSSTDWALFNSKQPAGAYLTSVNILDIKSTQGALPPWFNVSGACNAGEHLSYDSLNDRLQCAGFSLTSAQVSSALGFTPISSTSSSQVAGALGYTPVNRAGDTMTGALNLLSNGLSVGTNQLVVSGGNRHNIALRKTRCGGQSQRHRTLYWYRLQSLVAFGWRQRNGD